MQHAGRNILICEDLPAKGRRPVMFLSKPAFKSVGFVIFLGQNLLQLQRADVCRTAHVQPCFTAHKYQPAGRKIVIVAENERAQACISMSLTFF